MISGDSAAVSTNVGRMGQLRITKTEDNMGYYVDFVISGAVRTGDLPTGAMTRLEGILEEMEVIVKNMLPEIQ